MSLSPTILLMKQNTPIEEKPDAAPGLGGTWIYSASYGDSQVSYGVRNVLLTLHQNGVEITGQFEFKISCGEVAAGFRRGVVQGLRPSGFGILFSLDDSWLTNTGYVIDETTMKGWVLAERGDRILTGTWRAVRPAQLPAIRTSLLGQSTGDVNSPERGPIVLPALRPLRRLEVPDKVAA